MTIMTTCTLNCPPMFAVAGCVCVYDDVRHILLKDRVFSAPSAKANAQLFGALQSRTRGRAKPDCVQEQTTELSPKIRKKAQNCPPKSGKNKKKVTKIKKKPSIFDQKSAKSKQKTHQIRNDKHRKKRTHRFR